MLADVDGHTSTPSSSLIMRREGPFSRRRGKNSKFLTYSVSKVEKDQAVTKINNFSIVSGGHGPRGRGTAGSVGGGGPRLSEGLTQDRHSQLG